MSTNRSAAGASRRLGVGAGRLLRAWRALPPERRLAAYAAIGLFLTLFLPWYQRHFFIVVSGKLQPAADSETGWAAFSFVEAAVLLVAVAVLTLLFQRAEGKAFHVPGGDGGVITAAGLWTCVLVIWRIFDKQGASSQGQNAISSGIEWGIFVALAVAAFLTYAGSRVRAAHSPEPPLPGEDAAPAGAPPSPSRYGRERRARTPRPVPAQPSPRESRSARAERDARPAPADSRPSPAGSRPGPADSPRSTRRAGPVPADDPPTRRLRRHTTPLGSVPDWTPGPDETLDLRGRRTPREPPAPAAEPTPAPDLDEAPTQVESGERAPERGGSDARTVPKRGPEDAPTRPAGPAPSTAAARRERRDDDERRSDEQLTIPLHEDRPGD